MFILSFLFSIECILDDEIESYTKKLVNVLTKKMGVQYDVPLYVLHCNEPNAAAVTQSAIVIFSGLIAAVKTPEELVGVLAHEVGHIKSMHILRHKLAPSPVLTGIGIGLGAAVGAVTGGLGLMVALFGAQFSYREHFKQMRIEEMQADAAAVKVLEGLNWPTCGLQTFLERLMYKDYLIHYDLGLSTHPLSKSRIEKLKQISKCKDGVLPSWVTHDFKRIQAKVRGYIKRDTGASDLYEKTVALFFSRKFQGALTHVDQLLSSAPRDPYYLELKGDILAAKGSVAEASHYYKKVYDLNRNLKYLPLKLATSYMNANKEVDFCINMLGVNLLKNDNISYTWHLLGRAYSMKGQKGNALVCQIEEAFTRQDKKRVMQLMSQAEKLKPESQKLQQRLSDIKFLMRGGPKKVRA